jgi:hypothetical protein
MNFRSFQLFYKFNLLSGFERTRTKIFLIFFYFRNCFLSLLTCSQCAKAIKELLDKKFGASWHVVVGEGFGFEISYEVKQETPLFLRPCKTPSD